MIVLCYALHVVCFVHAPAAGPLRTWMRGLGFGVMALFLFDIARELFVLHSPHRPPIHILD